MATSTDIVAGKMADASENSPVSIEECASPWKRVKPATEDPEVIAKQKQLMAADDVVHSNDVPSQLERHLEFINFNAEGHMILGCSNLTGRYWIGSLWYYRSPTEAPSVEKALTGVDFGNGIVDGFFVDAKNIVVAGDNGGVEQVRLAFSDESIPSYFYLERILSVQEHDDLITGLVMTPDRIVTTSYDRSIVVLDKDNFKLVSRLSEAHADLIAHAAANKKNANAICTAGNDGQVTLWDVRSLQDSNSSCIYEDRSVRPTCVQFVPTEEHHLLVGNQAGLVQLFDVRKPKEVLVETKVSHRPITRLNFSPIEGSTAFSVCSESSAMKIFEITNALSAIALRYEDSRHEDFVRDAVWQPGCSNKIFSCGWDHKVLMHNLDEVEEN